MLIKFKKAGRLYRAGDVAGFTGKQEQYAKDCVRMGVAIEVRPILDDEGNATTEVEPVEVPAVDGGASAEPIDVGSMTKSELVELAEKRGIEVVRGDGQDGAPVKADYVRALTEKPAPKGEPESFEDLSDDELQDLADELDLEVTREDDEDGEPERADYLRALAERAEASEQE